MIREWKELDDRLNRIPYNIDLVKSANIVLFGAAMKGLWALYSMQAEGYKIAAFADNYFERFEERGGRYEGFLVVSPEKIKDIPNAFVIITTTGHLYQTIRNQLDRMDCPHMTHMELALLSHKEEFYKVYSEYLKDEKSRQVYINILLGHLSGDDGYFKEMYEHSQYFAVPAFDEIMVNEVYADVGAYVGDSVEKYVMRKGGVFKKIYAFEPTWDSYDAMVKRVHRLKEEWNFDEKKVECFHCAVGEKTAEMSVLEGETVSSSNHMQEACGSIEGESVKMVSLDEFFQDREEIPTFIKADIEGGELQLLRGAEKLIAKHKPKLALCIYHKDEDLYELPMELRRINPDYQFAIRHHTPQFNETVLYCW